MISNNKPKTNYEKFMEEMHSRFSLPDEQLDDLIKEATGSEIESKEKILKGEANQVFDITAKNGLQVIIRISKSDEQQFLQEKWAMEQCKKIGIPVPEILLIKHIEYEGENYSICILQKIDGDTLERGSIDMNSMNEAELKSLILQSGELLAKIHSIETTGFGVINAEGKGSLSGFDEVILEGVRKKEGCIELAKKNGFDTGVMEEIIEILASHAGKYKTLTPKLNHGDYGPKHFMVKENNIVAILDFGEAKSDSPIYDFAWWHYWFNDVDWGREGKLFEWLKEGYTDKSLFDNHFEEIMYLIQLHLGLGIFSSYDATSYKEGVEAAKRRLLRDYKFFK